MLPIPHPTPFHTFSAPTIPFVATAYCLKGLTRTGTPVGEGVIAVDPRIIPLHSIITIKHEVYVAEDIGSAIKGYRIDIWMRSCRAAILWGRRKVDVQLLKRVLTAKKFHSKP